MKGDLLDRIGAAFSDLENLLGELWDDLPAKDSARIGGVLKTVETAHERFNVEAFSDERDEDYERAAARYDGDGKDWR